MKESLRLRKMLRSASECFRNGVIQIRFIFVTDFDIIVVDVVTFAERKIAVSNKIAGAWSFRGVGGGE